MSARMDVPAEAAAPYVAPWDAPAVEIDVRRQSPARVLTGAFPARRRWAAVPAAAAAVVLVGASALLLQLRTRAPSVPERPAPMREVATGVGQRAELKLGDGSSVTLGVQSRLRFPADFGAKRRELYLEGEAYFRVVHDSTRSFIVHAGNAKTVDLGTGFMLRAYSTDDRVRVVVTEGRVALGSEQPGAAPPAVVVAGQMGQLAAGAPAPSVEAVDPSAYTAWLQGRLAFDDTPLADVVAELGRWYDVEIRLADPSLARETFTANFAADSFSETLRTLTTVLRLRAKRNGRTVVLHRR